MVSSSFYFLRDIPNFIPGIVKPRTIYPDSRGSAGHDARNRVCGIQVWLVEDGLQRTLLDWVMVWYHTADARV